MNWAEDLKLDPYHELIDKAKYRNERSSIDAMITTLESGEAMDTDCVEQREMDKFQKYQSESGTNMAIVMYMVDALKHFDGMANDKIKEIAYEIAMQGKTGYKTDGNYTLSLILKKEFTGHKILAYYYVSWALSMPDVLGELQLPFGHEYEVAMGMHGAM